MIDLHAWGHAWSLPGATSAAFDSMIESNRIL